MNFDPEDPLDSQDQADAYLNWCADQYARISVDEPRTFGKAIQGSAWLLVVSTAQLHLADELEPEFEPRRDELLDQLAQYQGLARAIERRHTNVPVERYIILRMSLDCWKPIGDWAEHLLTAARCAVNARVLSAMYPLVDFAGIECPDVWALLDAGADKLGEVETEGLTFDDFAIAPDSGTIAKWTWQRANNVVRRSGIDTDLNAN